MPHSRIPTTREIAEACGCSQSTVSNALRGDHRISDETRRRIQKTATDMGWRANPLASAFMAHLRATRAPRYQATLAFAVTNPAGPRVEDLPHNQRENFHGARARAEELGFRLEPLWLHEPGLNAGNLLRVLHNRGIPGLVLPGLPQPLPWLDDFPWDALGVVALGQTLQQTPLHRVSIDYSHSIPMALRRLRALGYRRIGVVVSTAYDHKVNHGWLYPLYYEQRHGVRPIRTCVFDGSSATDRLRVRGWIEREQPDAILGEYLAWHTLRDLGLRVPDDVAFATFDCSPEHPEIGGIDQRHDVIGASAVDLLATQLLHNERGLPSVCKKLLIEGGWRDAPSVPERVPLRGLPHG